MPIYEYRCNRCGTTFEHLIFCSDDVDALVCPSCGDGDTCRVLSCFSCGAGDSDRGTGSSLSSACSPSGGFS